MLHKAKSSVKQIITNTFKEYELSDENLAKLKKVLFGMLKDFKNICEILNIDYSLAGGTMLGAVRHKGFIPWDDDIDVLVKRKDIDKIKEYVDKNLSDKYYLLSLKYNNSNYLFFKLCLKGTDYSEILKSGTNESEPIFIDIFPIDNIVNNKFSRKMRGLGTRLGIGMYRDRMLAKYPAKVIVEKSKTNRDMKKLLNKIKFFGVLSHLMPLEFWRKLALHSVEYKNDKSTYQGIPTAIGYTREMFPRGFFDEYIDAEFEGEKFKILKNYKQYLTNLYGPTYMTPPPENKRERHIAVSIKFPEEKEKK
jgi:lipopolysaccharide cholinephosphotransferase